MVDRVGIETVDALQKVNKNLDYIINHMMTSGQSSRSHKLLQEIIRTNQLIDGVKADIRKADTTLNHLGLDVRQFMTRMTIIVTTGFALVVLAIFIS